MGSTLEDVLSEQIYIKSGVPQGRCLGPVLFVLFIDDLPEVIDLSTQIYAYNKNMFINVVDKGTELSIESDLTNFKDW